MSTFVSRRQLLQYGGSGFGYLALAGLLGRRAAADTNFKNPLAERSPHHTARAKRVIFMFMQGGPSHVDTFDYKPELQKQDKKSGRFEIAGNQVNGRLLASPWKFSQHGQSGLPISELFPEVARHSDDLCLINGMHTDNPAHPQATIMLHTGSINFVRPSIGSWIVYGLGSENQDLPGFVTINPVNNLGGTQNYGSSFLPASFQGTAIEAGRNALANIRNESLTTAQQRRQLELVQAMNREMAAVAPDQSEFEGIIQSYELAFRMQSSVPEVMDIRDESEATKTLYGIGEKETNHFGTQCLMARRLAESGVRFIEVANRGWDHHNGLNTRLPNNCRQVDRPIAGLLTDLKQRDLLEDTLVVWSGEFGRTPADQNGGNGRRHNHRGFTAWLAGGGVRGGLRYGRTDDTGWVAVEDKVHTHDLHATILHLLGLDHTRLTYRHAGRDFRLTDVHGNVVHDVIA